MSDPTDRSHARAVHEVRAAAPDVPAESDVARIAARARGRAQERGRGARPAPALTRRLVLAGAATAVLLAAVALAPGLTRPGSPLGATPSAYAAMRAAVSKTVAASSSGTVVSKLVVDEGRDRRKPERDLDTVFMWNGENVSVSMFGGERRMMLVDGRFYVRRNEDGTWVHYAQIDESDHAKEVRGWIGSATKLLAAGKVGEIAESLDGLEQTPGANGATVFTGTTSAERIADELSAGAPALGLPEFDGADPEAKVQVRITVGDDGIIRSWTCDFSDLGHDFDFTAEFSDIGTTAEIVAPDASQVVEGRLQEK